MLNGDIALENVANNLGKPYFNLNIYSFLDKNQVSEHPMLNL